MFCPATRDPNTSQNNVVYSLFLLLDPILPFSRSELYRLSTRLFTLYFPAWTTVVQSFLSRTEFSYYWDHVSFINTRVNAVEHCILAKLGDIYIRVSQNTWEFPPWRVRNWQPLLFLASRHTSTILITPFHLTISPLFRPVILLLMLNFLSEKA